MMSAEPQQLLRRGEELLDEVVQKSTETSRARLTRLRRTVIPILQSSIAAAAAFWIAQEALGHKQPFFAPIAAVISLGVSLGQRTRRAVEIILGVAVGVLAADLLAEFLGRGTAQIAVFVALAMAAAVLAGGGPLVVNQGAASAILIATLAPSGDPSSFAYSRFIDALIGGLVGLVVNALLLPLNPVVIARRAANRLLDELSDTLRDIASSLASSDVEAARAALHRAAELEGALEAFSEELGAGQEITRIAPARWRMQGHLAQYVDAIAYIEDGVRNVRVLARRTVVMLRVGESVDSKLPAAIRRLAESVRTLRNELAKGVTPRAARRGLVDTAEMVGAAKGQGFSAHVVVAQLWSTVSDLLQASGLSRKDADRVMSEFQPAR